MTARLLTSTDLPDPQRLRFWVYTDDLAMSCGPADGASGFYVSEPKNREEGMMEDVPPAAYLVFTNIIP